MTAPLAISLGCPAGVGPEVALRAALDGGGGLLVGDRALLEATADRLGIDRARVPVVDDPEALPEGAVGIWGAATPLREAIEPGRPTPEAGRAQLAWVDEATDLVVAGRAAAVVTGPVSKEVIASSGGAVARHFRGHTEHIARRVGGVPVMAFHHPAGSGAHAAPLTIALVTTHVALREVPSRITTERVMHAVTELGRLLPRIHDGDRFALAVASLNPHAGEGGLLGDEEAVAIAPGIAAAALEPSVSVVGPLGAETAFRRARDGDFAGVVAMYHDQATIVSKLLGFGEAINVTLGLPIVRTSVDHGTAYDLAGTGRASPSGMAAALKLARQLGR